MPDTKRLFFALWPPAAVQEAIAECAVSAGIRGKRVARERLHLTLAFLGDVDATVPDDLCAAADAIEAEAFDLVLSRLGHFYRASVAWVGPEATPGALADLAGQVRGAAGDAGVPVRSRRFRPHVTLARRAGRPSDWMLDAPIHWPVRDFSLTESVQIDGRAVYRDLARWSLTPV